ncbi:MAG: response regulator [Sphingomonas sp.]|uniref:response regulator transcription factor n=1 Tax=Sphingomonas sp. TaxID=28214 RepID=UPI001ACB7041|nr:response regulator [Sphingomonas sp.]MBN8816228.1 response regulator [Sphingomonas sp.]
MRIYVLDDDAAMCRTLARMLSSDGNQVCGFTGPAALLSAIEMASPDVLLLDIGLDGANGLDVLTQVTATRTELPVVMISGTSEVDDAIAAFRGGAVQFLRKPFRRSELEAALSDAARIGKERAHRLARTRTASAISLSKREHEVLAGMTEGLQSKLIAHRLGISLRTVDMHRANIFSKLSAKNATHAVAIARQLDLAR